MASEAFRIALETWHTHLGDAPQMGKMLAVKNFLTRFFTVEPEDTAEAQEAKTAYERAKARGLSVVSREGWTEFMRLTRR